MPHGGHGAANPTIHTWCTVTTAQHGACMTCTNMDHRQHPPSHPATLSQLQTAAWQMPGPAISLLPLPAAPSHVLHMGLTEGITLLSWPALADAAQRSAPRTSPARGAAVAATAAAGQPPVHALLPAPPGRRVQLTWGSQRDITTAAAASPVTAHELVVHTDRHGLVLLELGAGARVSVVPAWLHGRSQTPPPGAMRL